MGFKLGDIINDARTARRRTDAAAAPAQGYAVAPESPVLTDGGEEDEVADDADPAD